MVVIANWSTDVDVGRIIDILQKVYVSWWYRSVHTKRLIGWLKGPIDDEI